MINMGSGSGRDNPRANGLAEAFNKTLINIMKKTMDGNQRDWDNRLQEALWAYRTTYRTPTQATPYSLAFGVKAVLPLEVELPSLWVAMQNDMTMDECQQLRLDELDAMDEKRLIAQQNLEIYQAKMARAYDKMARVRAFQQGELVLVLKRPIISRHIGPKFSPNWEGSPCPSSASHRPEAVRSARKRVAHRAQQARPDNRPQGYQNIRYGYK
jgi:hypothetical protein